MRNLFCLSLLALLGACSDSPAPPAPLLQINAPTDGQPVKAGELLSLNATISDALGMEAVIVNLEGGEGEKRWFVTGFSSEQMTHNPTVYIIDEALSIPDTSSAGSYTLSFYIRNREGIITEEERSVQILR